jgi:acetylornithine deacetylase/succinyl-diaminopimelate desuccinylase-like protein
MCVFIFKFNYQEATGKNVMLLPMGSSDDGAHSQNEKIDIRNYIEGVSPKIFHNMM